MTAALNRFLELTGRLTLSPAEYGQAVAWGWDSMPEGVLMQLVESSLLGRPEPDRMGKRLGWIRWEVDEGYRNWCRAIGLV